MKKISVILPTRNRTTGLNLSIKSLINRAADPKILEILLAFDLDDYIGLAFFNENLKQWIIDEGCDLKILISPRLGYLHLNEYCNMLAKISKGDWIMMWNDDAIMDTDNWDQHIIKYTDQFKILSVITHNEHPNTIFPIVPKEYVQILGFFSRHQECDNEISQIAYMLDIFQRIPVHVTHDRADLTGNNNDQTYQERQMRKSFAFDEPGSFHHNDSVMQRLLDTEKIAKSMRYSNLDTSWWDSIVNKTNNDPWKKMKENDPNRQIDEVNTVTRLSVRDLEK